MSITTSQEPKEGPNHLAEVIWSETLSKDEGYQKLLVLWKGKQEAIEKVLRSITLTPDERDRQAFLLAGFTLALDTLREHHDSSLKLHHEAEQKELPGAPEKRPVL